LRSITDRFEDPLQGGIVDSGKTRVAQKVNVVKVGRDSGSIGIGEEVPGVGVACGGGFYGIVRYVLQ
jgi:hypothetical protein